jgi:putative spermidine/putrescine transport system substrate-binding protein
MTDLTRRDFLRTTGASAALFLAGGAPAVLGRNAALSGTITVMGYPGDFRDKFTRHIIVPFQRKFPNVTVSYFEGGNSAQMVGLLRSQRNDPQIDVAIIDASVTASVNQEGLFCALTDAELPNLRDLLPEATRFTKGFGPACTFDSYCLLYDTTRVSLRSLAQWWEPAHKGHIGFAAPPNIQGIALTLLVNRMMGGDYKRSVEPAFAKLRELAPSVRTFHPNPNGLTLVLNGAVSLSTSWNAGSQQRRDEVGGKLGILIPPEGAIVIMDTVNVVAGTKQLDAALAFANYVISAEAQRAFAEGTYYGATNAGSIVRDEVLKRSVGNPTLRSRFVPVDWAFVSPLRDQWTERWRRQVIAIPRG